jgi:hypothetical protein
LLAVDIALEAKKYRRNDTVAELQELSRSFEEPANSSVPHVYVFPDNKSVTGPCEQDRVFEIIKFFPPGAYPPGYFSADNPPYDGRSEDLIDSARAAFAVGPRTLRPTQWWDIKGAWRRRTVGDGNLAGKARLLSKWMDPRFRDLRARAIPVARSLFVPSARQQV